MRGLGFLLLLKGLLPYLPPPPYGGVVSEEVVAAASTPYEEVSYARKMSDTRCSLLVIHLLY